MYQNSSWGFWLDSNAIEGTVTLNVDGKDFKEIVGLGQTGFVALKKMVP